MEKIEDRDIPMQYVMSTVCMIIQRYSILGSGKKESLGTYPDVPAIIECIRLSGYTYYGEVSCD